MSTRVYEKGTIKVVWVKDDPEHIFSKMFDEEKEAVAFSQGKKDFLIFSLIFQKNMEEFSWKLLPHGRYTMYTILFRNYKRLKGNVLKTLNTII